MSKSRVQKSKVKQTKMKSSENEPIKTVVFLQPFPDITENEYNYLISLAKKNPFSKKVEIRYLGFRIAYEPSHGGFEEYTKTLKALLDIQETHEKGITESHSKRGEMIKIVRVALPKDQDGLEEVKLLMGKLALTDEIYINTHGNPQLIGSGPLAMNPKMLAINLKNIGLLPQSTPHISIWACDSGIENNRAGKSFTQNTIDQLRGEGFKNASGTGTMGILFSKRTAKKHTTYVGKKVKSDRGGKEYIVPNKPGQSLQVLATPNAKKQFDEAVESQDGIYTWNRKIANIRGERYKQNNDKLFLSPASSVKKSLISEFDKQASPKSTKEKTKKRHLTVGVFSPKGVRRSPYPLRSRAKRGPGRSRA